MTFLTGIGREPHKNVVQMDYAFARTTNGRVCESFVFEFLPDTVGSIIKKEALDDMDVRLYTWQLFNGLRYLQQHFIVHRDVKPVNILLDHQKGNLKIGDFGSAKIVTKGAPSTAYQVTRFYRSPELLLGASDYSWMIDVWSAGCCVAEMMSGKVLFPGKNTKHQMKQIITCIGVPTKKEMLHMKLHKVFNETSKIVPQTIPTRMSNVKLEMSEFVAQILKFGAKRTNGIFISSVIAKEDFQAAIRDDHENARNYAATALRGGIKFNFTHDDV